MNESSMSDIDQANIAFWDELCGTHLADVLGITDALPASLKRFDDWFFDFYPYLFDHVRLSELAGTDVLEVGLGYGSVSQKIAESGARFCGLDIAPGPVEMVRHRLRQALRLRRRLLTTAAMTRALTNGSRGARTRVQRRLWCRWCRICSMRSRAALK